MKDFIFLFRLNKESELKPSAGQVKERMNWLGNLAKQNKLADKGNTLSPAGAKTIQADKTVADAPHSEGKEIVTGYVIVKAENVEEAVEIAKANPIFEVGGSIEVREIARFIKGNE
ncbi:MAG TPA: transcription initiation protein [Porphyromonadaceae bacterium]|nr:transcription initiation protein [Porphyromonadaceae bacterium]